MRKDLLVVVFAVTLGVPSLGWAASPSTPEGYRETARERIAPGVTHRALALPDQQAINVAHIAPGADVALQAVSSFDTIAGRGRRGERTSSMCARVNCLAAVNGDFYAGGIPVGALVSNGSLTRSQPGKHHVLMVGSGRALDAGRLRWSGKLVTTDLRQIQIDGVNVPRPRGELVMYTPAFDRTTGTNEFGAELVLRFVRPAHPPQLDETAIVRLESFRYGKGDTKIPPDGAVLSGHGDTAEELRALWRRVKRNDASRDALLRFDSTQDVVEAIGGSPILLRDGEVWFANENRTFIRSRAPRTLIGWNEDGDVWLVTVDGRQSGFASGMSLLEAARLMQSLGATDAINLDGGGSTTFVVEGRVVNRPSDRLVSSGSATRIVPTVASDVRAPNVERPVANALVVVPSGQRAPAVGPPQPLDLSVPSANVVALPVPNATDPASNPRASLPAILEPAARPEPANAGGRELPFAAAAVLNVFVAGILLRRARERAAERLAGR